MKPLAIFHRRPMLNAAILAVSGFAFVAFAFNDEKKESAVGTSVTGVHHLGHDFNIPDVYLNGGYFGNIGRDGGGGSNHCCVMLPTKWRPGLVAEVQWSVTDWSKEDLDEIENSNYSSLIDVGHYRAIVPIEKYDNPGRVFVHIFPGGKVRIVSTDLGSLHPLHPVRMNDLRAADLATSGTKENQLLIETVSR